MERVINDITTNHVKAQYYEQRQHIVLQPKFFCDLQLTNSSIECIEIKVQIFSPSILQHLIPPSPFPHSGPTHTPTTLSLSPIRHPMSKIH